MYCFASALYLDLLSYSTGFSECSLFCQSANARSSHNFFDAVDFLVKVPSCASPCKWLLTQVVGFS